MKTLKLTPTAILVLSAFTASVAEAQDNSSKQQIYSQDSVEIVQIWERSSASNRDNQAPHWTDSLRTAPSLPEQAMGLEYGRSYGQVGAIRPAANEALGPVAIYFKATF